MSFWQRIMKGITVATIVGVISFTCWVAVILGSMKADTATNKKGLEDYKQLQQYKEVISLKALDAIDKKLDKVDVKIDRVDNKLDKILINDYVNNKTK
jgi:hypothetical protein